MSKMAQISRWVATHHLSKNMTNNNASNRERRVVDKSLYQQKGQKSLSSCKVRVFAGSWPSAKITHSEWVQQSSEIEGRFFQCLRKGWIVRWAKSQRLYPVLNFNRSVKALFTIKLTFTTNIASPKCLDHQVYTGRIKSEVNWWSAAGLG